MANTELVTINPLTSNERNTQETNDYADLYHEISVMNDISRENTKWMEVASIITTQAAGNMT